MPVEFTVGIPTHNRRETVLLALASALEQSRPPARVLVVADGCTDGTQEAVRALGDDRVEVLDRPKGRGAGYAHRNEVLERAGGGTVAWLGMTTSGCPIISSGRASCSTPARPRS